MGGAVSSGRDNNELIDNLMGGNYIRSRHVERVFRALDRADYMTPEARDQAYKDLAWRNGPLHMSAPCIYSEVMEGLQLKPGLSFLNVGSGTGYLSTLVGLLVGSGGINHGIEVHSQVVEYANKKLQLFMENSATLDEFDFCEPKFYCGNGLCLAPLQTPYDRVYCGAGCPEEYQSYFQQLIKVGGILVMPLNDNLLQVKRVSSTEWSTRSVLNVSFATLRVPTKEEDRELVRLEEQSPARLQALTRAVIRECMRGAMWRRHPELREPPPRAPPAKKACPRRICIPVDDDSDAEGLNALHDLDPESGAHEMNALLSLVLSMGRNRVAGALRVDNIDDSSSTEEADDADDGDNDDNDDDAPGNDGDAAPLAAEGNRDPQSSPEGSRTENPESAERSKTSEVPDESDRENRPERSNRRDRNSRSERPERPGPGDGSDRREPRDRSARSNRRDRGDRSDRANRRNRDRADRRDRSDRSDRPAVRSVFMFEFRNSRSNDNYEETTEAENIRSTADTNRERENARELSAVSSPAHTNEEVKESTSEEATPPRKGSPKSKGIKLICRRNRNPREARRRSRGSQSSDEKKDGDQANPEVPAEVEIFLGKSQEEPGTSTMDWHPIEPAKAEEKTEEAEGAEPKEHSSEEDTETSTSKTKEEKRQKLDSGIGDDNTVSAASSSTKGSDQSDSDRGSSSMDDEGVDSDVRGRRRRQKRGHLSTRSSSSTDEEDDEFDISFPEGTAPTRRLKRRSRSADDPRRMSLSLYMKAGAKELPLPHPLQKYVNLGRCFEL